jgi:hypothetical protein
MTDKHYSDLNKKKDKDSIIQARIFRLAINTIAYMKCFPECVVEGVPKLTIDRNESRTKNNLTFKISEKITDTNPSSQSKIPHFRKGHFRLLESDYFTQKKGMLIQWLKVMQKQFILQKKYII